MADPSIAQFCELTGSTPDVARQFLSGSDLQTAVASFYATQEGEDDDNEDEEEANAPAPAAAAAGSGSSRAPRTTGGGRFATLGSMRSDEHDDEDSEDEKKGPTNFFTGGEKSGLAVQNPDRKPPTGNNVVDEILRQANEGGESSSETPPTSSRDKKPARSAFTGSGMTLGSDETPSVAVPDAHVAASSRGARPRGARPGSAQALGEALMRSGMVSGVSSGGMDRLMGGMPGMPGGFPPGMNDDDEDDEDDGEPADQVAIRTLTFWQDGFSIGDGPLMAYEDARNKAILEAIKSGQAPRALLNVKVGQRVELRVAKKLDTKYQGPPPKPKKPFHGAGNRLGSPASEAQGNVSTGGASSMAASRAMAEMAGAAAAASESGQAQGEGFKLDQDKPQTSIQVRLADGTKLVARLNLTHTIGDIRNFITASQPAGRPFLIQTTFPNKVLEDDSQTVEQAGLANAVIVQRWT